MPTRTEYSHVIGLSTIDPKKDHMVILWELGDARIMHRAMGAARAVGVVARAVCTERWAPRGRLAWSRGRFAPSDGRRAGENPKK